MQDLLTQVSNQSLGWLLLQLQLNENALLQPGGANIGVFAVCRHQELPSGGGAKVNSFKNLLFSQNIS